GAGARGAPREGGPARAGLRGLRRGPPAGRGSGPRPVDGGLGPTTASWRGLGVGVDSVGRIGHCSTYVRSGRGGSVDDRSQLVRAALTTAGLVPGEVANGVSAAQAWAGVLEVVAGELAGACGEPREWAESARSAVEAGNDRAMRKWGGARAPLLAAQQEAGLWRRPGGRSVKAYRAAKDRG